MSGTAAILINPKAAKACIDLTHEIGIHAIDQFYIHAMFRKLILRGRFSVHHQFSWCKIKPGLKNPGEV